MFVFWLLNWLEIKSVSIFDPALWTIALLTYSLDTPPPPPPSLCQSTVQYILTVCVLERVGGVGSPVGNHILQEFKTLCLTRFRTYKIAGPSQTKITERRGPQPDKHLPQSPFSGKYFYMTTFLSISLIFLWLALFPTQSIAFNYVMNSEF